MLMPAEHTQASAVANFDNLFGYPNRERLSIAIETELSRRAFKEQLKNDDKPSQVGLNPLFHDIMTDSLLQIHAQLDVYGPDDREEVLLTARSANVERNIRSTAAVFYDFDLTDLGSGNGWELKKPAPTLHDRGVCTGQLFVEQPAVAMCTSFLIDSDLVATAAHCAESDYDVRGKLFVFDYRALTPNTVTTTFTDNQVFRGMKVIGRVELAFGEDWAVVRLERKVTGRDPLPLRVSGDISDNEPVYMVGYPSGLPEKYAPNAVVIRNDLTEDFFVTNLDAFNGNSGSPVFNASTDTVEGILVRGEIDYFLVGDCSIPTACPNGGEGCKGEHITRIKFVKYTP